MKKNVPALDDPREQAATDAYILGQPMGAIATVIFVCLMFVFPIGAAVYFYSHPITHACTQDKCK